MPTWIHDIYSQLSLHANHLKSHSAQIDQIQELLQRNNELQLVLSQANLRIAEPEAQYKQTDLTPQAPSHSQVPPASKRADGSSASQWADLAATPPGKSSQATKTTAPKPQITQPSNKTSNKTFKRPLTLDQLNRFNSVPSSTHGYRFMYFTTRGRERISKIRAGFSVLGLQQSRILDIHYLENNTISFLVHNDYASTVIEAMSKLPSSKLIPDFDPCASSLLRDPKYANNTDTSYLSAEAIRTHQERLIRIVKCIHISHIQIAVARDFCFTHQWITNEQYCDLYHCIFPDKASKLSSSLPNDDVTMDDTYSPDSVSQPAASSSTPSPADGLSALSV